MCVKSSRLWLPSSSGLAMETASCRAFLWLLTDYSMLLLCGLWPRTLMKQSLSLQCLCKQSAARHACLPGSTYSSEGHVTVLGNILLWAIVQPFPMSIFSLDWNKIHPTGKVIVSLGKNQQGFCCALMTTYPANVCVCFFSNVWQYFFHYNLHL